MPMHSGLPGLIEAFDTLRETESELVLATVIETAGSTYRKAGARMLITADGRFFGLLSGGCFEADLYEHARRVFDGRKAHTVFYDMRSGDDLVWGLGLGCNGAVRIRLEYLSAANDFAPLNLIRETLADHRPAVIMTVTATEHEQFPEGSHYLYAQQNGPAILPPELADTAAAVLAEGRSRGAELAVAGRPLQVFFGLAAPPVTLLLIGAGPDALPVTEVAALLGWDVIVVDHRAAFSQPERFPAARMVQTAPEALAENVNLGEVDAAVLMTHKFEYDQRYLAQLAGRPPAYIGLLGPEARKQQLLDGLGERAAELADRIYGPVGLDIGAELPEEIALSLVAEIQAVLRGCTGGRLSEPVQARQSALPGAARDSLYALVLAAGGSRRFGALKQLLEFNGQSLLRQTAAKAGALLGGRVVVVHGPKATKCRRELAGLDVSHVDNEEWHSGMSSSLQAGIRALPPDCRGVLILLCDQPLIESADLERLAQAWCAQPERIAAAAYAGGAGVPAIFPAHLFDEMCRLAGDSGARSLLDTHAADVVGVPLENAAFDIDTQADYEKLLTRKLSSG